MKKLLPLVLLSLVVAGTRSGAQAVHKFDPSVDISTHWAFSVMDDGRSVGSYVLDVLQSGSSNAITGQLRTTGPRSLNEKQAVQPFTGRYDRQTHAIAFTISVESPKGPQRVLFAGMHDWYRMTGAMADADGNIWSWTATRSAISGNK